MKKLQWIGIVGAFALVVGCDRQRDSAGTAVERETETARSEAGDELSPTAREGGSSSRFIVTDTNAAILKAADNTGRNVRDRDDATLTPGDQGESESDLQMTRRIRQDITANDALSTVAKNIKIITVNGTVTLRGPVNSELEKQTIASIVQQAGVTSFDNQLEVKTDNQQ